MIEREEFHALARRHRWQQIAATHNPRGDDPAPRARARSAALEEAAALARMAAPWVEQRRITPDVVVLVRHDGPED